MIWRCACARFCPGRGLVYVCPLPNFCLLVFFFFNFIFYFCLLPTKRFVTTQIFSVYSSCHFTVATTNTRPQTLRFFLRVQTCVLVDANQLLQLFFTRWPRADSFPVSRALGRTCLRLSRFCNIFLPDLAPLHVKITRSTNLLSVCRRKLKLPTYLHTVSYEHISFLNARSQFVRVLASSGFYSITWRMISRSAGYKILFQNSVRYSEETLSLVGVVSFASLNLYSLAIRPRLSCFHTIK